MSFGVLMVWRKRQNHVDDCYFCMINALGFTKKNKHKITYPDCKSALKHVAQNQDIPAPIPTPSYDIGSDDSSEASNAELTDTTGRPTIHLKLRRHKIPT